MTALGKNQMEVVILADGSVKITTGQMGTGPVHKAADDFLAFLARTLGGAVSEIKQAEGHAHTHAHDDQHHHA